MKAGALVAAAAGAAAAAAAATAHREARLHLRAREGERGHLLQHPRRTAARADDHLILATNQLLEVLLALHARVLVDRHGRSVLSNAVGVWATPTLEGQVVRLEPLSPEHEVDLFDASQDERIWRWLPVIQPRTPAQWHAWMEEARARETAGLDVPFATVLRETGKAVGSTRFLALRPEHGSVEIGWTWLRPSAWGTGANAEAKLLQLRHAFETWGCRRVELKTDAQNVPARRSMEAFGAVFEGVHRKHMLVRGGENRDSAWYSVVDDDWPATRVRLEARLATAVAAPNGGGETTP